MDDTRSNRPAIAAISGGIGSGKSTVAAILRASGFDVYDTDLAARRLMESDPQIHAAIAAQVDARAVEGGRLDRRRLAEVVFADSRRLEALNAIVHGRVVDDFRQWVSCHADSPALFVETALLYQSGLDRMVDAVWEVTAPEAVRIGRVIRRNGLTEAEVRARIDAQNAYVAGRRHPRELTIVNDGLRPLLPQVEQALAALASVPTP